MSDTKATTRKLKELSNEGATVFVHGASSEATDWLWRAFRDSQECRSFKEIFSDDLARAAPANSKNSLRRKTLAPAVSFAPDLIEYFPLMSAGEGMRALPARSLRGATFASDPLDTMLSAADETYLGALLASARQVGRIAVLTSSESMGRVEEIKARFGGVHIVAWQSPFQLWQAASGRHRLGDLTLLDRVFSVVDQSTDPFMKVLQDFLAFDTEQAFRFNLEQRYADVLAAFIAWNVYFVVRAARHADLLVNASALSESAEQTKALRHEIGRVCGLDLELSPPKLESGVPLGLIDDIPSIHRVIRMLLDQAWALIGAGADDLQFCDQMLNISWRDHARCVAYAKLFIAAYREGDWLVGQLDSKEVLLTSRQEMTNGLRDGGAVVPQRLTVLAVNAKPLREAVASVASETQLEEARAELEAVRYEHGLLLAKVAEHAEAAALASAETVSVKASLAHLEQRTVEAEMIAAAAKNALVRREAEYELALRDRTLAMQAAETSNERARSAEVLAETIRREVTDTERRIEQAKRDIVSAAVRGVALAKSLNNEKDAIRSLDEERNSLDAAFSYQKSALHLARRDLDRLQKLTFKQAETCRGMEREIAAQRAEHQAALELANTARIFLERELEARTQKHSKDLSLEISIRSSLQVESEKNARAIRQKDDQVSALRSEIDTLVADAKCKREQILMLEQQIADGQATIAEQGSIVAEDAERLSIANQRLEDIHSSFPWRAFASFRRMGGK